MMKYAIHCHTLSTRLPLRQLLSTLKTPDWQDDGSYWTTTDRLASPPKTVSQSWTQRSVLKTNYPAPHFHQANTDITLSALWRRRGRHRHTKIMCAWRHWDGSALFVEPPPRPTMEFSQGTLICSAALKASHSHREQSTEAQRRWTDVAMQHCSLTRGGGTITQVSRVYSFKCE